MSTVAPTQKALVFMLANDKSPVVSGAAMHIPGERECPENVIGCRYSLQNNQTFELSSADLRSMPQDYPKWKGL
jgi:hypothetical protein